VTTLVIRFLVGLAFMSAGSWLLPPLADWMSDRLDLPEGLAGSLAALAADSPEITTAIVALASGARDVGVGVVLGSNLYNIAALLGLSAVVAGGVRVRRRAIQFHGAVSIVVTLLATALVYGTIGPFVAFVLLVAVVTPYLGVLAVRTDDISALPLPARAIGPLKRAVLDARRESGEEHRERERERGGPRVASLSTALFGIAGLAAVIGGGTATVNAAIPLAERLDVPRALVGPLILAALTGLPNVSTTFRLARHGRGRAVVSEALNSNTINVIVGIAVPALFVGVRGNGATSHTEIWWLLATTAIAIALGSRRGGLTRVDGYVVLAVYAAFVAVLVL